MLVDQRAESQLVVVAVVVKSWALAVEAISIAPAVPRRAGRIANRAKPDRILWNLDVFMGETFWKPVLGSESETVMVENDGNDWGSPHDTC